MIWSAALLTASAAQATTIILIPIADTSLRNNSGDVTFGDSNPLLGGVSKEPFTVTNRILLKFDLSGIPTNATVTGVSLATAIFRSNTGPADYDLNRLLVDWSEEAATWGNRKASTPWNIGGGQSGIEYVATASVTAPIDDGMFSSAGMVSDVQLWLKNPGTNFGWIMSATGEPQGTGKQLGSRESSQPPILTVDYTLSSPVPPQVLFDASIAGSEFYFSFNVESNRAYGVEFIDENLAGEWVSLTNIPTLPANAVITVTNSISSSARFFRVRSL
jgi:hypothetical protein